MEQGLQTSKLARAILGTLRSTQCRRIKIGRPTRLQEMLSLMVTELSFTSVPQPSRMVQMVVSGSRRAGISQMELGIAQGARLCAKGSAHHPRHRQRRLRRRRIHRAPSLHSLLTILPSNGIPSTSPLGWKALQQSWTSILCTASATLPTTTSASKTAATTSTLTTMRSRAWNGCSAIP